MFYKHHSSFLIFAPKHRLCVPTINVLSKNVTVPGIFSLKEVYGRNSVFYIL